MTIEEKRVKNMANGNRKSKNAMIGLACERARLLVYVMHESYVSNWKHHKYRTISRTINKCRILQYTLKTFVMPITARRIRLVHTHTHKHVHACNQKYVHADTKFDIIHTYIRAEKEVLANERTREKSSENTLGNNKTIGPHMVPLATSQLTLVDRIRLTSLSLTHFSSLVCVCATFAFAAFFFYYLVSVVFALNFICCY